MKKFLSFLICSLLVSAHLLYAQSTRSGFDHLLTPVKSYVVYQTKMPLLIDGKEEETNWSQAEWTEDFSDIEGDTKPRPLFRTRVKMLYDASSLYVMAELEDPHIWATYNTHDQIIYHENDIEVFIDPDGDTHDYYEYELNARNTLLDLKMPLPYRNGGKANIPWNSIGFQSAVVIDGTLNDPRDTDQKWTVEMKIPFADLEVQHLPSDGETWRINFSRVQWRIHVVDGKYQKIKDPSTGHAYPEYNWVWSPPGLINMHYPERWGMIQFSELEVGKKTVNFIHPEEETISRHLWLIYYKQQDFKRKNNRYANSLKDLEMQDKDSDAGKIELTASENQFSVQVILKDGSVLSVNETGLFQINKNKTK